MTLKLRTKVNFPATVTAQGGFGITKENGIWRLEPRWGDLSLITSLPSPESKELWVWDPSTDVYSRLSVQALVDNLPAGPQGDTGPIGPPGQVGVTYTFSDDTSSSDPTAGYLKFNNATISSATAIYISELDASAGDVSAYLATWDDSTNTTRGTLKITKIASPSDFAIFTVSGSITDNGTWDTFSVSHVASGGSFSNDDDLSVEFFATGNKGTDGGGAGDVVGPSSSVDGEIALFDSTTGKAIKRASTSGILKASSGVLSAATAGTDYLAPGAIGVTVQAYDADTLKSDTTAALTAGYTATSDGDGTQSSGTYTPDPTTGNFKHVTNGGAFTLGVPSSTCTMIVEVTNNGSAGAITTSSYTKVTGDAFTTTNSSKFLCFITKTQNYSHLHVTALQ